MASYTRSFTDPRAALYFATDLAGERFEITSITSGVVVYADTTKSTSQLYSWNKAKLDAAFVILQNEAAWGTDISTAFDVTLPDDVQIAGQLGVVGATSLAGASLSGTLTFSAAAGKVIPGATSLSIRNHADSADNFLMNDSGVIAIGRASPDEFVGLGIKHSLVTTAGPASAFGIYLGPTLTGVIAVGGAQVLAGLRVAPIFATGGYSNVSSYGIYVNAVTVGTNTIGINIAGGSGGTTSNIGLNIGNVTGTGAFAIKTGTGPVDFGDSVNIASGKFYKVNGTQVVSARQTGWTAATNTKLRTTFDTTTVTTANLAARVGALIDDLITHGIIGA